MSLRSQSRQLCSLAAISSYAAPSYATIRASSTSVSVEPSVSTAAATASSRGQP